MALDNDFERIEDLFNIKLSTDEFSSMDVLNSFKEKVRYFKRTDVGKYEYAHITFYELDEDANPTSSKMIDIDTGISLGGLLSGLPSTNLRHSYRTGFGTKYMTPKTNYLLDLAKKLNALVRVIKNREPFNTEQSITTAISVNGGEKLGQIYSNSHWVTFIDPKVDLDFFKSDMENQLLIIHYSDQYTKSSGYDSITVTKRADQYKLIIEDFLLEKGVLGSAEDLTKVINAFNAINGDWLLRLVSSQSQFPREKMSLISAVKIALGYFHHPDIIWVPISMEEILRVSGGSGLSQTDGLFSAKNLGAKGAYSDDLLLVGVEKKESRCIMYLYPIEVKIGTITQGVLKKAIEQVSNTRSLLKDNLTEVAEDRQKVAEGLFRHFFAQLAVVSARKMELYKVWPEQKWDLITKSELRTRLLNDEFEISFAIERYIGKGAVICFNKETHFDQCYLNEENILEITLSESAGYMNILTEVELLKEKLIRGQSDFSRVKCSIMLINQLCITYPLMMIMLILIRKNTKYQKHLSPLMSR